MANRSDLKMQNARQFFVALQRRDAVKLLIIQTYGDTPSSAEVLRLLREYNATGTAVSPFRVQRLEHTTRVF